MTIGIYCLQFEGTDKVYIGKSKHVEERYKEHLYALRNNIASIKLQEAYNIFGTPRYVVIIDELQEYELDSAEIEAIQLYNSYKDGYNSTSGGTESVGGLAGLEAGNSKYTKEQIEKVLYLLIDPSIIPFSKISKDTGVSEDTVRDISSGRTHAWIQEEYSDIYQQILNMKYRRQSFKRCAKSRGISYPSILSPEGKVYSVDNISYFAKEHGLSKECLGRVLRGTQITHKGWILQ